MHFSKEWAASLSKKPVKDGQTSIEIIDPQIKPMVMHYNKDAGVFSPYMLSDYTEELAFTA